MSIQLHPITWCDIQIQLYTCARFYYNIRKLLFQVWINYSMMIAIINYLLEKIQLI